MMVPVLLGYLCFITANLQILKRLENTSNYSTKHTFCSLRRVQLCGDDTVHPDIAVQGFFGFV